MHDPREQPGLAAWQAVLERISQDVHAFETALAEQQAVEVEPWTLPEDLGPLPEQLREQAVAVAAELARAQQQAAEHRDQLGAELRDLERRRGAGRAYASTGGRRAG
ncbi:MAG: hypothetical protein ACLFRD_00995 [Nitriliruptoraceae bacterium]